MSNEVTGFLPRILAIAKNAFREAVRDRILYNLILFVLLITAGAVFLGDLTVGQEARVIVNLGLSATLIFGTFISIFVGVSLVWKEIEKRTIYSILSKPVGRGEFIIGKYLGLCLTLFVNVAVMGLGITLALLYVHGSKFAGAIWPAISLIFLELTILTAVLPLSILSAKASGSRSRSIRFTNRINMSCLVSAEVFDQAGNAAFAASTARCTSRSSESAIRE